MEASPSWSATRGITEASRWSPLADLGLRNYVSERDRGRRRCSGKFAARHAVNTNRRRIRSRCGRRLVRDRGEWPKRPDVHLYETGRMRRVHLHGHANIRKRFVIHKRLLIPPLRHEAGRPHAAPDGSRHAAQPHRRRPRFSSSP